MDAGAVVVNAILIAFGLWAILTDLGKYWRP
jgi:hypothetical protein